VENFESTKLKSKKKIVCCWRVDLLSGSKNPEGEEKKKKKKKKKKKHGFFARKGERRNAAAAPRDCAPHAARPG
jgi:hypothetical protein